MALHGFAWLCMALHGFAGSDWSCGNCGQEAKSTIEARLQEAEASQASLTEELQDLAQLRTSWRLAPSVLTILVPSLACLFFESCGMWGSERESIGKQPFKDIDIYDIYIY